MSSTPVWAAVVPVKGGPLAKSRLALPLGWRAALATAFARDTVAALRAADPAMVVLVVTGDEGVAAWARSDGARAVADPGAGLDAAVRAGVAAASGTGATRVAVVLGDHPSLRPAEVRVALASVAGTDRAVVPDAAGTGTALLTMPVGPVAPTAFGAGSADAHERLGYVRHTPDAPGLRQDVDDADGLAAAARLGLGPHTTAALARATLPGVQATIHRTPDDDGAGAALLDDGTEVAVPGAAVEGSGLRHLRVGQRVTVELDEGGRVATRVWVVGIGPGETIR